MCIYTDIYIALVSSNVAGTSPWPSHGSMDCPNRVAGVSSESSENNFDG